MLTELTKRVSRQQLHTYGHFSREELIHLLQDGWRITWREKRKITQVRKNGMRVERVV